ncbi:putative UDP-N-acetylglucosamine--peptide N-acetylglucosaminyltransferase SPINDLY [Gossypium arboreum]|uniref:Putative UDP-N-acetylglucosamine--peptide N-acetylglucosaminyltransferase SPINDLY n=1 Tax=Gossypium arboreum TaxID=29729 RepID=A0A0B0PK34_GOSAR|nr:putative UDP-N-acetylglucosamine--peptide N-acetylglucosaminyltransferase SPINDLY [Gossypium arboreum]
MVMVEGPNWKYSKTNVAPETSSKKGKEKVNKDIDVGLVRYNWHAIGLEVFRDIPTCILASTEETLYIIPRVWVGFVYPFKSESC